MSFGQVSETVRDRSGKGRDPTGSGPGIGDHNILWFGWRGRIRTFDLLIQSQAPYRLATRQWFVLGPGSAAARPLAISG